jgi:hypothetical protein
MIITTANLRPKIHRAINKLISDMSFFKVNAFNVWLPTPDKIDALEEALFWAMVTLEEFPVAQGSIVTKISNTPRRGIVLYISNGNAWVSWDDGAQTIEAVSFLRSGDSDIGQWSFGVDRL